MLRYIGQRVVVFCFVIPVFASVNISLKHKLLDVVKNWQLEQASNPQLAAGRCT